MQNNILSFGQANVLLQLSVVRILFVNKSKSNVSFYFLFWWNTYALFCVGLLKTEVGSCKVTKCKQIQDVSFFVTLWTAIQIQKLCSFAEHVQAFYHKILTRLMNSVDVILLNRNLIGCIQNSPRQKWKHNQKYRYVKFYSGRQRKAWLSKILTSMYKECWILYCWYSERSVIQNSSPIFCLLAEKITLLPNFSTEYHPLASMCSKIVMTMTLVCPVFRSATYLIPHLSQNSHCLRQILEHSFKLSETVI